MPALGALVEVQMVGSVEHVEPVEAVLARVAVHDVQQHDDAHAVRGVDEFAQVVRRAVPAAGGEEARDLVAEAGVVGMLHDRHQLDHVVPEVLDAWQDVAGEFLVRADAQLRRRDAHVRFVDASALGLRRPRVSKDVPLRRGRVPEDGVVDGRHGHVLGDAGDPGRHTLDAFARRQHHGDLTLPLELERGPTDEETPP